MAMSLSYSKFLRTLPPQVIAHLPPPLRAITVNQPWSWLVQFHYGEPRIHFEVTRALRHSGFELGLHFESRDHELNRFLLEGFQRHLFEIKDTLGHGVEAEMWDKGWTKVYEVYPEQELTPGFQDEIGHRLAAMICCLQPILVDLRQQARV
jgi:hypothetical protein